MSINVNENGYIDMTIKEPSRSQYESFKQELSRELKKHFIIRRLLKQLNVFELEIDNLKERLAEAKRISILPKEEYIEFMEDIKIRKNANIKKLESENKKLHKEVKKLVEEITMLKVKYGEINNT